MGCENCKHLEFYNSIKSLYCTHIDLSVMLDHAKWISRRLNAKKTSGMFRNAAGTLCENYSTFYEMIDLTNCANYTPIKFNKEKIANFSNPYFKLFADKGTIITTIKSTKYLAKHNLKMGDIGWLSLNNQKLRLAKIINLEQSKIAEIDLRLLQKDANAPKHTITCHEDFVDLLNTFAIKAYGYGNNRLTTTKSIIFLELLTPPIFNPIIETQLEGIFL